MLFRSDSGAETDTISPDFIRANHIPLLKLEDPLLQMGTKGTRSCVYYRTHMEIETHSRSKRHYFDVVNIDRYDAILGTPWLNAQGASLDFKSHLVRVLGGEIKGLTIEEDRATKSHGWKAWAKA